MMRGGVGERDCLRMEGCICTKSDVRMKTGVGVGITSGVCMRFWAELKDEKGISIKWIGGVVGINDE